MRFLLISALCLMVMPTLAQEAPPAFNKCAACHTIGPGAVNKVGPQLNGLLDQPAARLGDYNYSPAMLAARAAGVTWSRQALIRYLKRPRHFIAGTSMAFAGMTKRVEIETIIDYLASFDAGGARLAP